ncbi:MAG TPA: HAD family hydrolase [Terriglobia bacterium]|nr:HAD family hydrolase [Terriglobia bacterium]
MNKLELVIFDIGGTLVEDRGEVPKALLSACQENGVAASAAEIRRFRGASKREFIRALVRRQWGEAAPENEARAGAIAARFESCLEEAYGSSGGRGIAGAAACLSSLRERGVAIAVNSGFPRRIAELLLARANLAGLFNAVITGDEVPQGRPAPYLIFRAMECTGATDVRAVVTVGDTPLDIQAGRNGGVGQVVAVSTGAYTSEELREYAPDHILPSVASLPELLSTFGGRP